MNIPKFLYGTAWKENKTERCVGEALGAGFRGVDTANQRKHYFEKGVGAALDFFYLQGTFTREDIFIQTKFTSIHGQDDRLPYDAHAPLSIQVMQSFESSLENLNTDFLDSYLLHGPSQWVGLSSEDLAIWGAMENLFKAEKVKILGISNVSVDQLQSLYAVAQVKPTFVQNRCFARTGWDKEVRLFCREHQIIYQGFSLLTANLEILNHPRLTEISRRIHCTPAQTLFCFSQQIGILPLTGTTNLQHMKEDLNSLNFELTPEEVCQIEKSFIK